MILSAVTILLVGSFTVDNVRCLLLLSSCTETPNEKVNQNTRISSEQKAVDALNGWSKDGDLAVTQPSNNPNEKSTQQQLNVNGKNLTEVLQDLNDIRGHNVESVSLDEINQWKKSWDEDKDNISLTMKLVSKETAAEIQQYLPDLTKQSSLADIVKERNLIRSFYKKLQEVNKVNLEQKCNQIKPELTKKPTDCPSKKSTDTDYPYLTFVCTCALENTCNISNDDKDSLIFFSQYDSKRVKALVSFYKNGMGHTQSDPTPEELSHKLFSKLCELADKEKNPEKSLRQTSRENRGQDENTITNVKKSWEDSLKTFAQVFEQCPKKIPAPQQNKEQGKK